MTTGTGVKTTGTINGGPETRTIHHGVFYDIQYSYHSSANMSFVP